MVKLDTRPARPLTSREISSIVTAAITPPLMKGKIDEVRALLAMLIDPATAPSAAPPRAALAIAHTLVGPEPGWPAIVGAVIGGLQRSSAAATATAVRWVLEHLHEITASVAPPATPTASA